MLNYPFSPGWKDPDTSRMAAEAVDARVTALHGRILALLRRASEGLTADEAAMSLGESVLLIRPRFSELHRRGYIKDSERRRPNESGRLAKVWILADREGVER